MSREIEADVRSETARTAAYPALLAALGEAATLNSVLSLLHWDQETMMPPAGAMLRADQLATLASLVHQRRTDPRIGEWLEASEADGAVGSDPHAQANLREIRRLYERAVRLPDTLVKEMAQTFSLAMEAWKEAREKSDYASFEPWLQKVIRLNRAKAECWDARSGAEMYDVLLDQYEPGASSADVERVFSALRGALVPMIGSIAEAPRRPSRLPPGLRFPIEAQKAFNHTVAERLGFAFAGGRLDVSTHPFCQDIGPGDIRITTRYREDDFTDSLSTTMHEAGHALYEQGLPKAEHWGQPLSEAASFGLHESQSRLWENMVGRSWAFWEWALPVARETLGNGVRELSVPDVYGLVNIVEPTLIRVDSDEATYNLHIMLRFDLERALLSGDLPTSDLPAAWNERVETDLGIRVPDDRRGCLQDVHWSMGAIGYFPTYTLGNLYSAQFWSAIHRDVSDLDGSVREGEFGSLLQWLRERIHVHGMRYGARELCRNVTGSDLRHEPLVRYLEEKLAPLYGL